MTVPAAGTAKMSAHGPSTDERVAATAAAVRAAALSAAALSVAAGAVAAAVRAAASARESEAPTGAHRGPPKTSPLKHSSGGHVAPSPALSSVLAAPPM
jgi:hypothetical protein